MKRRDLSRAELFSVQTGKVVAQAVSASESRTERMQGAGQNVASSSPRPHAPEKFSQNSK
ncbi:MAG: hypothetical protein PUB37_07075 [Firmicutes bacterium]|nr:hypothetical protein [Bacillota bacterium]